MEVQQRIPLINWHCQRCRAILARIGLETKPISLKCHDCGTVNIKA